MKMTNKSMSTVEHGLEHMWISKVRACA